MLTLNEQCVIIRKKGLSAQHPLFLTFYPSRRGHRSIVRRRTRQPGGWTLEMTLMDKGWRYMMHLRFCGGIG
jgi:hypothetical protein